ncbi:MAG: VCBS repeat-containing protein [Planctomycetes bacterium]|nr:VCBS repeat-containing protein [Planctomycetota bacterium]
MRMHALTLFGCVLATLTIAPMARAQTPPLFSGGDSGLPLAPVVTQGDFDGDGRTDIASFDVLDPVAKTFCVRLFRGDGFGRFQPTTWTYPLPNGVNQSAHALTALDLVGDGRPELVYFVSTAVPISIEQFILRFDSATGWVLVDLTPIAGVGGSVGMVRGDFDADGDWDIGSLRHGNGLAMYEQKSPTEFVDSGLVLVPGTFFNSIVAADLNADGRDDLVAGESFFPKLHVFLGRDGGGFTTLPTITLDPGSLPLANLAVGPMSIADIDEDGLHDLVIGTTFNVVGSVGDVAWYRGNGAGGFSPMQHFAQGIGARALAVADLDHDGHLDVQMGGVGGLLAAFGNGAGAFSTPFAPDVGGTVSTSFSGPSMAMGLFDGDDVYDVVTYDSAVAVRTYLGSEPGRFSTAPLQSGPNPAALASTVFDADGDGDVDYVTYSLNSGYRAALNDGTGSFSTTVTTPGPIQPIYAFAAAHVDGDTLPDLVAVPFGSAGIEWRKNLGGGSFGPQNFVTSPAPSGPLDLIAAGDLDGDGDDDVVATALNAVSGLSVFHNVGGSLVAVQFVASGLFHGPLDFTLTDLTGDGALDVLCASNSTNRIRVFPSLGNGTFGAPFDAGPDVTVRDIASGDLDQDGDADLAVTTHTSVPAPSGGSFIKVQVRAWLRGPGGSLTESAVIDLSGSPEQLSVVDIDLDGDLDVVGRFTTRAAVFLGDGAGGLIVDGYYGLGAQKADGIAAANFDADPDLELAYHRWTDPTVHVLDHVFHEK